MRKVHKRKISLISVASSRCVLAMSSRANSVAESTNLPKRRGFGPEVGVVLRSLPSIPQCTEHTQYFTHWPLWLATQGFSWDHDNQLDPVTYHARVLATYMHRYRVWHTGVACGCNTHAIPCTHTCMYSVAKTLAWWVTGSSWLSWSQGNPWVASHSGQWN